MRSAFLITLGALVALGCLAPLTLAADQAPDFTLPDVAGKKVKLSDVYKDGPVIVSFWSTWCKNCPAEMKHFQRFYDKYKDQGLTVLSISIDNSRTVAKVKPWVMGNRFTFPVLLDTNNDVMRLYHVRPVPHSFVVNQKGEIVYSHVGFRPGDEQGYEKAVLGLLAMGEKESPDAS